MTVRSGQQVHATDLGPWSQECRTRDRANHQHRIAQHLGHQWLCGRERQD